MPDSHNDRIFHYRVTDYTTQPLPTSRGYTAVGCAMPDTYLNGRPVYIGDIEYDGVDSFILDACYADTLEDLEDGDMEDLNAQEIDYVSERVLAHYGYGPK